MKEVFDIFLRENGVQNRERNQEFIFIFCSINIYFIRQTEHLTKVFSNEPLKAKVGQINCGRLAKQNAINLDRK